MASSLAMPAAAWHGPARQHFRGRRGNRYAPQI